MEATKKDIELAVRVLEINLSTVLKEIHERLMELEKKYRKLSLMVHDNETQILNLTLNQNHQPKSK